jgi:hypothetical protein
MIDQRTLGNRGFLFWGISCYEVVLVKALSCMGRRMGPPSMGFIQNLNSN